MNGLRSNPFGRIFNPDKFIFAGGTGSGNNYAKCFHVLGPSILEESYELIRREVERCDWLTGFQMIHSIGGGTGSAMSSLLLPLLDEGYPKNVTTTFTAMPSAKISDTVVEPYNSILSLPQLIDHSNLSVCLDNEALYDICGKVLKLQRPMYDDLNLLTAKVISGMSATYRFPARNHVSWRVLQCLAPHPKLHFFVPGFVPLAARSVQPYTNVTVDAITSQMLANGPSVLMASVNKVQGKYLSAAALFRGCNVGQLNVDELLCRFESKNASQFAPWMPYHFMKGICVTPPRGLRMSATFLANHTSSTAIFNRILERYSKIFKKKAFLHWYTGEGLSLDEFKQAEEKVRGLVKLYKNAEANPPPGWKSPEDNPVFKKVLAEEKAVQVVNIVTIVPRFTVLQAVRRSLECVQIFGLQG